jgi:hypothetical protein
LFKRDRLTEVHARVKEYAALRGVQSLFREIGTTVEMRDTFKEGRRYFVEQ